MAECKRWRVTVSTFGNPTAARAVEVEANHWIAALTAAHRLWGQVDRLPPGASCAVAPDGTVTVFDGHSRSKTVLSQLPLVSPHKPPIAASSGHGSAVEAALTPVSSRDQGASAAPSAPEPTRPHLSPPTPVAGPFPTMTSAGSSSPGHAQRDHVRKAGIAPSAAGQRLRMILQRNDDPTAASPLTYRERAFAISPGTALVEAERALKAYLRELQAELKAAPRGQFINLAVFDHSWSDVPHRPPLITLEWMDWRGREVVAYPANALRSQQPTTEQEEAERLANLFEAFKDLPHVRSSAAALDLALELLALAVPCAASSACLYDLNADQLRFVATRGQGAEERQGTAISPRRGLLGKAMQRDGEASAHTITGDEPDFDPEVDARPGLVTQTLLLRPLCHHGQVLGALQLINRSGREELFTPGDLNLANYVGDRLAHTLSDLRASQARTKPQDS